MNCVDCEYIETCTISDKVGYRGCMKYKPKEEKKKEKQIVLGNKYERI